MTRTAAASLALSLGGGRAGTGWMARCPVHDDSTPSLAISETRDGRLLVHCHAGCSQSVVIAALRERELWQLPTRVQSDRSARPIAARDPGVKQRIAQAMKVWCEARPAAGTAIESYLRSRGIEVRLPPSLRLHVGLHHRSGTTWPAMVALVTHGVTNTPVGVHRTWLRHDGTAKAPVSPNKMMLGPCRGGAVRLAPGSNPLMIGEGIETCLAAMQATGNAAWAALSTSGMRILELSATVREVIILADGDQPGEAAAVNAATRWQAEGRSVRIARPPLGSDFNDVLIDRGFSKEAGQ